MATVKKEDGVKIVKDDVTMENPEKLIPKNELNQLVKQANAENQKLTEDDVREHRVELDAKGDEVLIKQDHPGRSIDTMSKRQRELLKRAIKEEMGILRKGRAVDLNSKRQKTLAERAEKAAQGLLRRGRPAYTPEQAAQAEKDKKAREKAREAEIKEYAKQWVAEQREAGKLKEVE